MDNNSNEKEPDITLEPTNNEEQPSEKGPSFGGINEISQKRDLSAIIPKFEEFSNEEGIELISRDNTLKSDGAVSIGTITVDGDIVPNENAVMPEQIDMEQRKIEQQKNKASKKKKERKKRNKTAQKIQNTTALASLMIMLALGGFFYYLYKRPTDKDFTPLNITVELGDKLPSAMSSYVKPGVGKLTNEMAYARDLSQVDVSKVGVYDFTITYKGIKKTGTITIKDTKAPILEVREVVISENGTFDASSFVQRCSDSSGCNYSFQDETITSKYTSPGSYIVYIVARDAFDNATTKKASLIIEATGNLRSYYKEVPYNNSLGYELYETYDLRFMNAAQDAILLSGNHTVEYRYQSKDRYEKAREQYNGEVNYSCDDAKMIIRFAESNKTSIGSNYSQLRDIESYLNREGFTMK